MNKDNGYYLFSLNGEYYLYDYVGNIIVEVNEELYKTLKEYTQGNGFKDNRIVKSFLQNGLLQKIDNDFVSFDLKQDEIAYLSFAPTYKCNFRCKYCFGKYGNTYKGIEREFSKDSVEKMLNYFFNKSFPKANHYRIDFVSGGEPLLGFEIIKYAIEYIERYCVSSGKRVSVWLCTNASLLTEEIIEYFSKHNVSIGISIDGRQEYNDANRIDIYGNGTYNQICKGISLIQNSSKSNKKIKNIWGLCTATNENCDFVDMLKHMKMLGFQNVQIRLIRSKGHYDVKKIEYQYSHLVKFLLDKYSEGNLDFFRMILNDNDQFGKVLKRVMLDYFLVRRCNAGINKVTICPDGTIYPCDSLVGIEEFLLGNIDDPNIKQGYRDITVNSISECKNCEVKYLCGGDCYYNSYMKTGCHLQPDTEFCHIQKNIIQQAIILRYKMQIINEKLYMDFFKEVKMKNDYSEFFG